MNRRGGGSLFTDEQRKRAVERYLENGCDNAKTREELGFPFASETLSRWVDELAPGARPRPRVATHELRAECALRLARGERIADIARETGYHRETLRRWRDEAAGKAVPYHRGNAKPRAKGDVPMADIPKELPQDPKELVRYVGELKRRATRLEAEVKHLELQRDVARETARILGKGHAGPKGLTSAEKAELVDALVPAYLQKDVMAEISWNRSSYHYQLRLRDKPDKYAELRVQVRSSFEASGGAYGYRRVKADLDKDDTRVSEKVVRRLMAEEGLVAKTSRKRRRLNTYQGETAPAPANLVARDFHASAPNELWLSDFTEFHIPAGKVYLSPILDCFCGELPAWSISEHPDAELGKASLEGACEKLEEGEHPVTHTDRGAPYRGSLWVSTCERHGLVRSMSKKGSSPDNAACEGLFGRIKVEFFYGRDWRGVSVAEFMAELDGYLHWYNEVRIKASLGYMSPTQYRIAWEEEHRASIVGNVSVTS